MTAKRSGGKRDRRAPLGGVSGPDQERAETGPQSAALGKGMGPPTAPPPAGNDTGAQNGEDAPFGAVNWVLAVVGVACLIAGFILLSKADVRGDNASATLSPFIILGAYLMIFAAIVVRAPASRRTGRRPDGESQ